MREGLSDEGEDSLQVSWGNYKEKPISWKQKVVATE